MKEAGKYTLQIAMPYANLAKGTEIYIDLEDEIVTIDRKRVIEWLEGFCLEFVNNKKILKEIRPEADLLKKMKLTQAEWKVYVKMLKKELDNE